MPKKVTIELTETQARIVMLAVEEWFRLRMGQPADLASDLALYDVKGDKDALDQAIMKRGVLEDVIRGMFRIAFPPYGQPRELAHGVNIASDMWSALRYELLDHKDCTFTPYQVGEDPLPKITVMEAKEDATD